MKKTLIKKKVVVEKEREIKEEMLYLIWSLIWPNAMAIKEKSD
jgi:hypothetical protein